MLVDFELASVAFTRALNGTAQQYFSDRQKITDYGYRGDDVSGLFSGYGITHFRFLTGRMPGTGEWRLDGVENSWFAGERDDEADDLAKNKYKIFGWDTEWEFSTKPSVMSSNVNQEQDKDGWWNGYYTEENKNDDRPRQSVDQMVSIVKSKLNSWIGNGQCVILLHDRQFHGNPDGSNPYIEQLAEFVEKCKNEGFEFDVLENYQS